MAEQKMERTLILIKPDGVQRGLIGEIIKRFELRGCKISSMRMIQVCIINFKFKFKFLSVEFVSFIT